MEGMFWISDVSRLNTITVNWWIELQDVTWKRASGYLVPKSDLLLAIQGYCNELGIVYSLPEQPFRSVDNNGKGQKNDVLLPTGISDDLILLRSGER